MNTQRNGGYERNLVTAFFTFGHDVQKWIGGKMDIKELKDLSQGSRIAYVRCFRGLTQAELGIRCGFKPESAGTRIAQYETNTRCPKQEMLGKISKALDIYPKFLEHYDFQDMNDVYYLRSWMDIVDKTFLSRHVERLLRFQSKYAAFCMGEISHSDFLNWLFKEGEREWNQQEISED